MRHLALASLVLLGCSDSGRLRPDGGGGGGDGAAQNADGNGIDQCSDQAKLVYVVDSNNTFSSFSPATLTFTDIGMLSCPALPAATPFSMGVDRSATAWVLYSSGELFSVDTSSLKCSKSSYVVQQNMMNFGMGFATNAVGGTDETLFIAGGAGGAGTLTPAKLATLSFPALAVTSVGSVTGWPKLTGTGDAKLWGFFPDAIAPHVAQLDKGTGAELKSFSAASLKGMPSAWAFAFWGGDFWIFLERSTDGSTRVHQMKSSDGSLTTPLPSTGRHIVGAGVSTCAPITIS